MTGKNEVKNFFDDLSSGWSERYKKLNSMEDRKKIFSNCLKKSNKNNSKILDFGCGSGDITTYLHDLNHEMTALDISHKMLSEAKANFNGRNINCKLYSGSGSIELSDAYFDVIISSSVMEYVEDVEYVLKDFNRLLKPGGYLFITVPDMRHRIRNKESIIMKFISVKPLNYLLSKSRWSEGVRYLNLSKNRYSIKRWEEIISASGFVIHEVPNCLSPLVLLTAKK